MSAIILYQVLYRVLTFHPGWDATTILASAYNYIHGFGLGLLSPVINDLSTVEFQSFRAWAPGWPFAMAGLLAVLKEPFLAMVAFDAAGIAFLYLGLRAWLRSLEPMISARMRLVVLAFAGFIAPPFGWWYDSDVVAFGLLMVGLACLSKRERSHSSLWDVGAGASVGLAFAFRYAHLLVAVAMPLVTLLVAPEPERKKRFKLQLAGAAPFVVPLLIWLVMFRGSGWLLPANPSSYRFNPEGLLAIHPFGSDPLFGFVHARSLSFRPPLFWRHLLSGVMLGLAVWGYRRWRQRLPSWPENDRRRLRAAACAAAVAAGGTLITLVLMTLLTATRTEWNYVQEPRYYLPLYPALLLGLLGLVPAGDRVSKVPFGSLLLLVILSILAQATVLSRKLPRIVRTEIRAPLALERSAHRQVERVLTQFRSASSPNVYIDASPSPWQSSIHRCRVAVLSGYVAGRQGDLSDVATSRPVNLVILAEREDSSSVKKVGEVCRHRNGARIETHLYKGCQLTLLPGPLLPVGRSNTGDARTFRGPSGIRSGDPRGAER